MTLNHQRHLLLSQLEAHQAFNTAETEHLNRIINFLRRQSEPFSRTTLEGHITASAVVVDERMQMALIWHEKLHRWLQPGGHCEPDLDMILADTARRELVEETTIAADSVFLLDEKPFDVDVHPFPERGSESAHFHYDVRFLFQTKHDLLPKDASRFRWIPLEDLAAMPDESLARFAHKLLG